MSTGNAWLNRDSLSDLNVLDSGSNLHNGPRRLVPEYDGAVQNEVSDASPLPVMDIAPADACLCDVNSDVVLVSEFGDCTILECYVLDRSKHEGWILATQTTLTNAQVCGGLALTVSSFILAAVCTVNFSLKNEDKRE